MGNSCSAMSRLINRTTPSLSGLSPTRCNPASPALGDTRACSTATMERFADSHWSAWFDDPIPMLGGQTPIEAAKTEEGQAKLLQLLELYAQQGAFHPDKPNIPWLRLAPACSARDTQMEQLAAVCPALCETIEKFVENHWASWFHSAQPMLNNETPIQANKSEQGTKLLENMFAYYAQWQDCFNPLNPNIPWLRRQLQLQGGEHFWPREKIQGENCNPEYVLRSFFGDEPLGFYGSTNPFPKEAMIERNNGVMYHPDQAAWDAELTDKFLHLYPKLEAGNLDYWRLSPEGVLATIVLCDQASRNIFRNTAKAWLYDARAQDVVLAAAENSEIMKGIVNLHPSWLHLFLHPFLHAEDSRIQAKGRELVVAHMTNSSSVYDFVPKYKYHPDLKMMCFTLFYLDMHAQVITQFGRFVSRNEFLSRENTAEENKAMAEGTCFGAPGWSMADAKAAWNEANPQFKC